MNDIEAYFSNPGSELYRIVMGTGGSPRQAQIAYAIAMSDLLKHDRTIGAFQAETGTGKTIGYLTAALIRAATHNEQVVVSTHTIELQRQILHDTLPKLVEFVAAATGGKLLKAARRIGKRNFISVPALEMAHLEVLSIGADGPKANLLAEIIEWLADNPSCAIRQDIELQFGLRLTESGLNGDFWDRVNIGSIPNDDSLYLKSIKEADNADIVVINHSLLVLDLMSFGRVLGNVDSAHGKRNRILIVDEADTLHAVTLQMCTRNLPLSTIRSVTNRMSIPPKKSVKLANHIDQLETIFDEAFISAHTSDLGNTTPRLFTLGHEASRRLEAKLQSALEDILPIIVQADGNDHGDKVELSDIRTLTGDIEAVIANLTSIGKGETRQSISALYWTPVRKAPGFHIDGQNYKTVLSRLWGQSDIAPRTLLFTSASLSSLKDPTNMESFAIEIGMKLKSDTYRKMICRHFAPEQFGAMDFVVIDQGLAPPVRINTGTDEGTETNPAIVPWWSAMINEAHSRGGRILVLTPSYADAKAIYDDVRKANNQANLIIEQKGQSSASLRSFIENEGAILITPNRWTGLDLPGLIRHIVIPRIPRNPPNLIYDALLEEVLKSKGFSTKAIRDRRHPASIALARRKLQQGIGRGIRTKADRVTIWIGDPRWPLTEDQKENHPTIKSTWVTQLQNAIPHRFTAKLHRPEIFRMETGTNLTPLPSTSSKAREFIASRRYRRRPAQ